jgi:hypothetical protein
VCAGPRAPPSVGRPCPPLIGRADLPTVCSCDLCGHAGTTVTEKVYRHQLRPVLLTAAVAMDRIFAEDRGRTEP